MRKAIGCLSAYGLIAGLILAMGIGVAIWTRGQAALFSPGRLAEARGAGVPLQGYASHAEMEAECALCHRPWAGADPTRCLACHDDVRAEIADGRALHGRLDALSGCVACHPEHQGRDAGIARARLDLLPHDQMGFSLAQHRERADGSALTCADCHIAGYALQPGICASCHDEMDAPFVARHTDAYGAACRSCHTGASLLEPFDHDARFALDGAHVQTACATCHDGISLTRFGAGCVACHDEPALHAGQFGVACAACHTTQAWRPARLQAHRFPLDHGEGPDVQCRVCHPDNYVAYTCYGCHAHPVEVVADLHRAAGIASIQDCAGCHPTGQKDEE